MFNKTSARHSEFFAFDPKDYSGILSSGVLSIGITRLRRIDSDADIARAIKASITDTLLVDNVSIETGTHAGLIIVAGDQALETISNTAFTKAQEVINSKMSGGDPLKQVCLNLGVYRQSKEQIDVLTIFGGMKFPVSRM
jgi:hypothetical protein